MPIVLSSVLSAISVGFWFTRYSDLPFEIQSPMRQAAVMAGLAVLVLFTVIPELTKKQMDFMEQSLAFSGFITGGVIISWRLLGHDVTLEVPLFDNPSMAACFVAISCFILDRDVIKRFEGSTILRAIFWSSGIVAVLLTKSSAPLVALAAGFSALTFRRFPLSTIGVAVSGAVAFIRYGGEYASDNSRFEMWNWMLTKWWDSGPFAWAFGLGIGTTRVHLPIVAVDYGKEQLGSFFWMHNDWLQTFVEQGVFGFASLLLLAYGILSRAYNRPMLHAGLVAYAAVMFFNFPLHYPVHALFGVILGWQAIASRPDPRHDDLMDALRYNELSKGDVGIWGRG
jgi:hypothetical protein